MASKAPRKVETSFIWIKKKKCLSHTHSRMNECYNRFNNQDFCFLEMMNLLIDGKTDFWTFLLCKTVTKEKTISIVIDIHTVCQRLKISIVNIKFVKHLHLLFIDISVSQFSHLNILFKQVWSLNFCQEIAVFDSRGE